MMNRKFTITWSRLDTNFSRRCSGIVTCTPSGKGVNACGTPILVIGSGEILEADTFESLRIKFEMGGQEE